jgi:hypothetical protein
MKQLAQIITRWPATDGDVTFTLSAASNAKLVPRDASRGDDLGRLRPDLTKPAPREQTTCVDRTLSAGLSNPS